jgi:NAD(P)H-flavin reductase/ferredoxin/truncated hemoglobin YjbI
MKKLLYQGNEYSCRDDETVLQALTRQGVSIPFSCGNGICHVCLQRCDKGDIPTKSQNGLRTSLKERGYFLPCKCTPHGNMSITPPRASDLYNRAIVYKKELLTPNICRLLLEPATPLYYHAGQFINIRNKNGDIRSYSLASVPHEDYFLEIHVKYMPDGVMSGWIFNDLSENDELEFQGPMGHCHYVSGEKEQPLLLIGTGVGLSPLLGIARDALSSDHTGQIYLYHGSRERQDFYLRSLLEELSMQYQNFHPFFCTSAETAMPDFIHGYADEIAFKEHKDLVNWRIFLCGQPAMVKSARVAALAGGINDLKIHADSFWDLSNHSVTDEDSDNKDINKEMIQCLERRKYPQPDLELWGALEEGKLLSKILADFYNHVYDDPFLSPYFDKITKQRIIEKQYNFLCQVLTGKDVYFGERPRNAHHWMVISNELFDHRGELMASSLRRYDVPDHLIKRFCAIEGFYRKDIVKDKPWNKMLFGKELPLEGFDEMTLDDATLCDSCQQEIASGSRIQYHVRLGKVYCQKCSNTA